MSRAVSIEKFTINHYKTGWCRKQPKSAENESAVFFVAYDKTAKKYAQGEAAYSKSSSDSPYILTPFCLSSSAVTPSPGMSVCVNEPS